MAGAAPAPVAIGVIDARREDADPGVYDAVVATVRAVRGVRLPIDPVLVDALAGRDRALAAARARQRAAEAAYATQRCGDVAALVEDAALGLLAAAPAPVGESRADLARLFALALLCAHEAGDRTAASAWVERLRALRVAEPPAGVPAEAWAQYPEIDATSNAQLVKLRIEGEGEGVVWLDLRELGAAPVEALVTPGRHWLVVRGAARAVDVTNRPSRQVVQLAAARPGDAAKRWESLRDRVQAWRRGEPPAGQTLAQAMRDAGLVLTVLLVSPAEAQVWRIVPARGGQGTRAERIATVPADDQVALTRALHAAIASPDGAPLVPAAPVKPPWYRQSTWTWIAVGAGVLLVGAGVIYLAAGGGDDRARIEATVP